MPLPPAIDVERLEGDKEYREELRHRCQTDLLFLAPFLGFYDFRDDLHGPVADFYVKKKPGLRIEFQDEEFKNRLHLDPRHTYKTSAGVVDQVQWVITCPNITIVNETATQGLAGLLTRRVSGVFVKPKTKPPTVFQRLFPEFVVEKLKGNYIAPCRTTTEIEPTIYSTSVGSSQSGYHPWVLNPDDVADTENSGIDATDASRDRVWNSYTVNLNTLRHGGYQNVRGTRYHPFDLYGRMMRTMDPEKWKVLIRGSVRVLSGKRLVEGEFPRPEELEMLWPGMLEYEFLRGLFNTDYRSFMCQQQNDPQGGGVATFPMDLYQQALIEEERVPALGDTRVCWRLASDAKGYMKHYAHGVAMRDLGGRMYVVDAWRGNYTPSELAERVIAGCKKHQTGELVIEKTPGADSLIPHIQNEAVMKNVSVRIEQPDFEADDSKRTGRMANLEPIMKAGRLWITRGLTQRDALRLQFTNFRLVEDNGFVDVISRLASRIPVSVLRTQATEAQVTMRERARQSSAWDSIYGHGGAELVEDRLRREAKAAASQQNSYGLPNVLGGLDG